MWSCCRRCEALRARGGPLTLAAGAQHPAEADLARWYGQTPAHTAVLAVGVGWRRPGCCWLSDSDRGGPGASVCQRCSWWSAEGHVLTDGPASQRRMGRSQGAVTRAFPAAEVWARDCGDQGATVCRPEAWWSVGGVRGQGDGWQTGCGTRDTVRGYRVWSLSLRRQFLGLERKQGLFRGELWVYLLCSAQ